MQYYFREITTPEEMYNWLRLRFTVYQNSRFSSLAQKMADREIDLDAYDLRSRHYGLFIEQADQQVMIGGLRIIQNKPHLPTVQLLRALDLIPQERVSKDKALPVFNYFPDGTTLINNLIDERSLATEGSRLVLLKEHQSLRLAKFIISNAIVVHLAKGSDWTAFVSCTRLHGLIYNSFNFRKLEVEATWEGEQAISLMHLRREFLSDEQHARLGVMTQAFLEKGYTALEVPMAAPKKQQVALAKSA